MYGMKIGSAERSDRIRTYNFVQDRITDHRVGLSKFGIDKMLRGEFVMEFYSALAKQDRTEALKALSDS